ncbi:MAG: LysM peptidoglycan-binding domain-containing protein [Brevinematia bacterium]
MIFTNTIKKFLTISLSISVLSINATAKEHINYKVKKGDTFFSLSRKFNTEVWIIQKENSISTLREGDIIKIPIRNNIIHIVQKGDTLFSLSKHYNTTLEEIISANNLQSIDIKIGQKIIIPSAKYSTPLQTPKKKYNTHQNTDNVYVVKKGDTIFSISRKTGTSIEKIKKLNNLNNNSIIKPGMIIVLDKEYKKEIPKSPSFEMKNLNYSLPLSFTTYVRNHSSKFLEIISNREEDIKSVMDGKVIFIGAFSIFGKTIIIKHSDNLYSIYGMVDKETVKIGDNVKRNETIGKPTKDPSTGRYIIKFSFIINDKMIIPNRI